MIHRIAMLKWKETQENKDEKKNEQKYKQIIFIIQKQNDPSWYAMHLI